MKRFVFGLATCAIALASCSTNDVLEQGSGSNNPNVINFSATTTRASVNDLGSLKDSEKGGFGVYATSGNNPEVWHIQGEKYQYTSNAWDWVNAEPKWPTAADGYPMNFYAYYPIEADGFSVSGAEIPLKGSFTIDADPANQIDFLAANYLKVTTKPVAGKLNLNFEHITSKVNFSIIAGTGANVFVQQMHMNNVGDQGEFKYSELAWTLTDGQEGKYKYWPIAAIPVNATGGTTKLTTFDVTGVDELTAAPMYPTNATRHMMLRPQTNTPGWLGTKEDATVGEKILTITKAYIESVYRISTTLDPNAVGYESAVNHPNYPNDPTASTSPWKNYIGPLFVKVGFPLGTELTWFKGRGYNYNIKLGTTDATGGIIIDDFYYDENGNRTDLPINGKEPGDPVDDGKIHFNVTVSNWGDDIITAPNPDTIQ